MQTVNPILIRRRPVPKLERYKKIHPNVLKYRVSKRSFPLQKTRNKRIKRAFDIFFSLAVISLILSWFLPLLAIIILLDSRGRVFYVQQRGGYKGRTFNCYKLRTMRPHEGAFRQATKNDNRVTRVGKYLRKYNLDELPQFFNVLSGEMSVVGPRPHAIAHDEQLLVNTPNYALRWRVKPGITGLSQSRGHRGETKHMFQMKSRATLDNFYIDKWTFKLDMKIIWRTIVKIENAY